MNLPPLNTAETLPARPPSARVKLEFLDGMRAFAALAVVFYHAFHAQAKYAENVFGNSPETLMLLQAFGWLNYGSLAVPVFIVISGYCLMLPVATSADGRLSGGVAGFFKRRIRRILPPYYVALALSLLMTYALAFASQHLSQFRTLNVPHVTMGQILSHLFLVHNLSNSWRFTIDGPMWSVATEWQIYFLFAIMLLPVWRRFGNTGALVVAFVLGLAPDLPIPYLHLLHRYIYCSEFLGLFALGMSGAVVAMSSQATYVRLREKTPWGILFLIVFAALLGRLVFQPAWLEAWWTVNILVGVATTLFIVYCTQSCRAAEAKSRPLIVRLLESRTAIAVGAFSYSIYLIHHPIVIIISQALQRLHLAPLLSFAVLICVSLPIALGIAYLFYLAFERPFVSHAARTTAKRVQWKPFWVRNASVDAEEYAAP